MQSFLQRRRAGQAARAQIDRDLEKARLNLVKIKANDICLGEEPASTANPQLLEEIADENNIPEANEHSKGPSPPRDGTLEDEITREPTVFGATVQRINTARTHISERTALGRVLTGIHVRDRYSHEGHGSQVFIVHWESPSDPLNPHNWSIRRRIGAMLQIAMIGLFLTAASGIDAAVLPQAAAELDVSETAESLATGLLYPMKISSLKPMLTDHFQACI